MSASRITMYPTAPNAIGVPVDCQAIAGCIGCTDAAKPFRYRNSALHKRSLWLTPRARPERRCEAARVGQGPARASHLFGSEMAGSRSLVRPWGETTSHDESFQLPCGVHA